MGFLPPRPRTALGVLVGLSLFAGVSIAQTPPGVPDAATPGGAQPEEPARPHDPRDPYGELIDAPGPRTHRDDQADAGERIQVRAFRLADVRDRPERGLRVEDLQDLVDALVEEHPDGFTLGMLQEAADRVAAQYRARGFLLAQAYVPEQTVMDGVVVIRVVEGRLDRVVTDGAELYNDELLAGPFLHQVGKPVIKRDVESALLRVRDYPGLDVVGVLQPGSEPGGTDLVLKVRRERALELVVGEDNYGTEYTGDFRTFLHLASNNTTGRADRLSLSLLRTLDPNNTTYGSVQYRCPLPEPDWRLGLSWQRTKFSVGQAFNVLGVWSQTDIATLSLDHPITRGRASSSYARMDLSRKQAATHTLAGASLGDDVLAVAALEVGGEFRDDVLAGVNSGYASWHHGFAGTLGSLRASNDPQSSRRGASGTYAGGRFDKFVAGCSRMQRLGGDQLLMLNVLWQHADELLTSLEQLGVGGPRSARAYPPSEYLLERGTIWSVEWIVRAPGAAHEPAFGGYTWGDLYQVSVFADFARGTRLEPLVDRPGHVDLRDVGLSIQCGIPGRLLVQVSVATPTVGVRPSNGRDPQTFFGLSWRF